MLNLATGKNELAPVALTRRDFGKGLAAILAAGCAPAIASAAGGLVRGTAARAARTASWLPYDAEVEWLQSDGSQYIDTGIVGAQFMGFEIKASEFVTGTVYGHFSGTSSSWERYEFGRRDNVGSGMFYSFNEIDYITDGTVNMADVHVFKLVRKQGKNPVFYVDDVYKRSFDYYPATPDDKSFGLFGKHGLEWELFAGSKCWYANFYRSDTGLTTGDFIPVRKGRLGFMYDRVSGKLFGNAADDNAGFPARLVGPDVSAANGGGIS